MVNEPAPEIVSTPEPVFIRPFSVRVCPLSAVVVAAPVYWRVLPTAFPASVLAADEV